MTATRTPNVTDTWFDEEAARLTAVAEAGKAEAVANPKAVELLTTLAAEARDLVERESEFRGSSWAAAVQRLAEIDAALGEVAR